MKYYLQLFVIVLFSTSQIIAQNTNVNEDVIYGLDAIIINGEVYNNIINKNIKGHQYLKSEDFNQGAVKIDGVNYQCESLNFDIVEQELILNYTTPFGSVKAISISDAWIESFNIGNSHFIIEKLEDQKQIYQVLNEDSIQMYFSWSKKISLSNKSGKPFYSYSKAIRKAYLKQNGQIIAFKNKKQFLENFSEVHRPLLKKFLRTNKIKIKKANELKMLTLINYCNSITSS